MQLRRRIRQCFYLSIPICLGQAVVLQTRPSTAKEVSHGFLSPQDEALERQEYLLAQAEWLAV
jgi:hypothetical protein